MNKGFENFFEERDERMTTSGKYISAVEKQFHTTINTF